MEIPSNLVNLVLFLIVFVFYLFVAVSSIRPEEAKFICRLQWWGIVLLYFVTLIYHFLDTGDFGYIGSGSRSTRYVLVPLHITYANTAALIVLLGYLFSLGIAENWLDRSRQFKWLTYFIIFLVIQPLVVPFLTQFFLLFPLIDKILIFYLFTVLLIAIGCSVYFYLKNTKVFLLVPVFLTMIGVLYQSIHYTYKTFDFWFVVYVGHLGSSLLLMILLVLNRFLNHKQVVKGSP